MSNEKKALPTWLAWVRGLTFYGTIGVASWVIFELLSIAPEWVMALSCFVLLFSGCALLIKGEDIWDSYTKFLFWTINKVTYVPERKLTGFVKYLSNKKTELDSVINMCLWEIARVEELIQTMDAEIETKRTIRANFIGKDIHQVKLYSFFIANRECDREDAQDRLARIKKFLSFLYDLQANWIRSLQDLIEWEQRRKEEYDLYKQIQSDLKKEGKLSDLAHNEDLYSAATKSFDNNVRDRLYQIGSFSIEVKSCRSALKSKGKVKELFDHIESKLWTLPPDYSIFDKEQRVEAPTKEFVM